MKKVIRSLIKSIPMVKRMDFEVKRYHKNACFPPGHFYSPIVNVDEIEKNASRIWAGRELKELKGIDLHVDQQMEHLSKIASYYNEIPFKEEIEESSDLRYSFNNGMYSFTDGIILYGMLRHLSPKKVIEIGSGHSSALMLDTNRLFFSNTIELTFIEPYPDRLYKTISEKDKDNTHIIEQGVQEVPLSVFAALNEGDILFVDSTHVSKCGSDVNYILFDILPILKPGVFIHFHDIFYPFEYPKEWVLKGYNWNENYLLKAFLMHNKNYSMQFFADFMHLHYRSAFDKMPLCYKNTGGNLWLKKEQ